MFQMLDSRFHDTSQISKFRKFHQGFPLKRAPHYVLYLTGEWFTHPLPPWVGWSWCLQGAEIIAAHGCRSTTGSSALNRLGSGWCAFGRASVCFDPFWNGWDVWGPEKKWLLGMGFTGGGGVFFFETRNHQMRPILGRWQMVWVGNAMDPCFSWREMSQTKCGWLSWRFWRWKLCLYSGSWN